MTQGFYKLDNGELLHAPNRVENASYVLARDDTAMPERLASAKAGKGGKLGEPAVLTVEKFGAETPVTDGWRWFDSEAEARAAYGLPEAPSEMG